MHIDMLVNGIEIKCDVETQLYIDINDLETEVCTQPSLVAWWASLAAHKQEEVARAKSLSEQNIAVLQIEVRRQLAASGGKVTEGTVDMTLKATPEYRVFIDSVLELKRDLDILKSIAKGFSDRTSMLTMAAAMHNAEIKSFHTGAAK